MPIDRRKALFLFSLCLLSLGYGMAAASYRLFPYTLVDDAGSALRALVEVYHSPDDAASAPDAIAAPTAFSYSPGAGDELLLVSGGVGYHADLSSTGSCLAWIMDREGSVRHVWEYDPEIWSDLERVTAAPFKSEIFPVGLHLYEDGGLLVSFQGLQCWPYGIGLARFDPDGRLLWKHERFNHHWFSVAEDGRIYVGALRIAESPVPLGETAGRIVSDDGKVSDDTVMILDADGNVLTEISMLQALLNSGWVGLFQGATDSNIDAFTRDPTHLNDIRLVDEELAARHDWLNAGDLLLSFRSINAVGILDVETQRFKWLATGATIRQHSPRFVGDSVLVFDNRGGPAELGGSRLVSIDLESQLPTTVFPVGPITATDRPFYTKTAGHLEIADERRVIVALSEEGNLWEVDIATGEVLWEYVYVDPATHRRKPLYTALSVSRTFEFNREATP